jgi:uncharacterized membrane protein SpoIIM required for sporulation
MKRAAHFEPRSVRFRREREAGWEELDRLVEIALRRGLRAVPDDDVPRLVVLYRSVLSSLAVARRTALDRALVLYLDALAARAYLVVYALRRPARTELADFVRIYFPKAVRRLAPEVAVALGLFLLGVALACALYASDPEWFYAFVSSELASGRTPTASTAELRRALYHGAPGLTTFASFLFTHNAKIGMLAFAVGIAAGVPTALLLFSNGLVMGAFLALYADRGLLVPVLGWLLPHGIPEIGAVVLCGAAGLHVGRALVWPGSLAVRDALTLAGRRAALIVGGSVLLFAVAGVIEGVFRQLVTSDAARFALVLFNVAWFVAWITSGWGTERGDSDRRISGP